jgi:hypothetical protein
MSIFHGTITFILMLILLQGCNDDVKFHREQKTFVECVDASDPNCRAARPGTTFKKTFVIDTEEKKKADILFIVDTSGSMNYEQEHIRERFASFIQSLNSIDWRVGIATSIIHYLSDYQGSGGNLIPFADDVGVNSILIDSNTPNATGLFSRTIRRPKSCALNNGFDDCDDHERAIYQANLIIDRQSQHQFFRLGSEVNIVIISDEDEKSNGQNLEELDLPETLVKNAATLGARSFTVHAIINRPDDKKCLDGQGVEYGRIYRRVAELTGGVIGNVCDKDYSHQLRTIAGTITQAAQSLDMPCQLQEAPIVSTLPVLDASYGFVIQNNKLVFNKAVPGGTEINVEGVCVAE